jgi:formate hydrogenlyase subunit 3/multisubunit Na+/H+ antiporter MnhD subunit
MRQMGGAYLYSFDITVLLFGVCFNLAGLPYSAGFLGKEFLLFQVLRDDFISILVRGCWLVSFFFTPIYMFLLIFLVMFSIKKGSISAYKSVWGALLKDMATVIYSVKTNKYSSAEATHSSVIQFQFTAITSRSTSYFLFSF